MPRPSLLKRAGSALLVSALAWSALSGIAFAGPHVLLPPEQILRWQPRTLADLSRPFGIELPGRRASDLTFHRGAAQAIVGNGVSGRWSEIGPPPRTGAVLSLDTAHDQLVCFGGGEGPWAIASVWTKSLASDDAPWMMRSVTGDVMPAGSRLLGTFDPVHRRLIAVLSDSVLHVAILALDAGDHWTLIDAANAPPGRNGAGVAYDPVRDAVVVHGGWLGNGPTALAEIWRLPLSGAPAWEPLTPAGMPVAARDLWMVYDPASDRMVVPDCSGPAIASFTLGESSTWSQVPSAGLRCDPTTRAVLDPVAGELYEAAPAGAVLALSLSDGSSRELLHDGMGDGRARFGMVFDGERGRLLRYGGAQEQLAFTLADIQEMPLAGGGWQPVGPHAPGSHFWHDAVLDPARHEMIVYGGWPYGLRDTLASLSLGPLGGWRRLEPEPGPAPRLRFGQSLVLDPEGDRLLLFGGQATDGTGDYLDDLWSLTLADPPRWTRIAPVGPAPGGHRFHSAIWDAPRHRLVVFGGDDGTKVYRDVWQATFTGDSATWTLLSPDVGETFGYPLVEVVPGADEAWGITYPDLLWRIPLTGPMTPVAEPVGGLEPIIGFQVLGLDPRAGRWVGAPPNFFTASRTRLDSLWTMPIVGPHDWTVAATAGPAPPPRFLESTVFDPVTGRMIVHGGYDDNMEYFGDTWALQWDQPTPALASLVSATADARGTRLEWQLDGGLVAAVQQRREGTDWEEVARIAADGSGRVRFDGPPLARAERRGFRLALGGDGSAPFSGEVWMVGPALAPLALAGAVQNPCTDALVVAFTLGDAGPASLELLDLAGRRLEWAFLPVAAAGEQRLQLAPRGRHAPGVYFVRLRQGADERFARVAIVR